MIVEDTNTQRWDSHDKHHSHNPEIIHEKSSDDRSDDRAKCPEDFEGRLYSAILMRVDESVREIVDSESKENE